MLPRGILDVDMLKSIFSRQGRFEAIYLREVGMSFGKIISLMALCVLVGVPLVAYLWETINQVLALQFDPLRLAITVPVIAVLWVFLRFVGNRIRTLPEPHEVE